MIQKSIVWGLWIFLVVLVGGVIFAGVRQETTFSEQLSIVYAPEYGRIKCDRLPDQTPVVKALPQGITEMQCGGVNKYIPGGCPIILIQDAPYGGTFSGSIWQCGNAATSMNDGSCKKIIDTGMVGSLIRQGGIKNGENNLGRIPYEGKIFIDVRSRLFYDTGDWTIRLEGERYGLSDLQRGREVLSTDCNTGSLGLNYHPLQPVGRQLTPQDPILNFIIGFTQQVNAANRITYNGQDIYVVSPGYYYPIKKANDGVLYADTANGKFESAIACMPSQPFCESTGSGTRVRADATGKKCDPILGVGTVDSFVPVSATKVCTLVCKKGETVEGECKARITTCPDGEHIDPLKYECTATIAGSTQQIACAKEGGTWKQKDTEQCDGFLCIQKKKITESYCDTTSGWAKVLPWVLAAVLVLLLLFVILQGTKRNTYPQQQRIMRRRQR